MQHRQVINNPRGVSVQKAMHGTGATPTKITLSRKGDLLLSLVPKDLLQLTSTEGTSHPEAQVLASLTEFVFSLELAGGDYKAASVAMRYADRPRFSDIMHAYEHGDIKLCFKAASAAMRYRARPCFSDIMYAYEHGDMKLCFNLIKLLPASHDDSNKLIVCASKRGYPTLAHEVLKIFPDAPLRKPVMAACKKGHMTVIQVLLGADSNHSGLTETLECLLARTTLREECDMLQVLLAYSAKFIYSLQNMLSLLNKAVCKGLTKAVKVWLQHTEIREIFLAKQGHYRRLISRACRHDRLEVVALLLLHLPAGFINSGWMLNMPSKIFPPCFNKQPRPATHFTRGTVLYSAYAVKQGALALITDRMSVVTITLHENLPGVLVDIISEYLSYSSLDAVEDARARLEIEAENRVCTWSHIHSYALHGTGKRGRSSVTFRSQPSRRSLRKRRCTSHI